MKGQLKLLSITGKELLQENWELEAGINQFNLPIANLTAGVYLVYFENANGRMVRKLVVEQ